MRLKTSNPPPEMIAKARQTAGMTQAEAAATVHLSAYQRWAEYERGTSAIDPARWELFLLITGQHPKYQPLRAA